MSMRVPFNRPFAAPTTIQYITQAINNWHLSGDGPYTRSCHAVLEQELGCTKALLTTSCTHALEISALLLRIAPGDEVIFPAFTFVSTVNAFVLRGAIPVFCDIRPDTLNMNETQIERLITSKTRAIVPVHYAGVGCEMDAIVAIAAAHDIAIVEDNAHGLFGCYKGRQLGTFGELSTLSFHETKNFSCGEGGALIVNSAEFVDRAEVIREKGTNRSRFFRGQVDKYTWVDIGSSYLPSDLLAAFLLAQFEIRNEIQAGRKRVWHYYQEHLAEWAVAYQVQLPTIPPHCQQAYHMFYLLLPNLELRQAFIAHLKSLGISSVFHYLPLHLSDMGRSFGGVVGQCPITEQISDQLVRLPFYNDMSEADLALVVAGVKSFRF